MQIGGMKKLRLLWLNDNLLKGDVSPSKLAAASPLPALASLQYCSFYSSPSTCFDVSAFPFIPPEQVPRTLVNLSELETCALHNNKLKGSIPAGLLTSLPRCRGG